MPKITIDGKELTVDEGKTIIQAADENGIEIPRYCYHPGLSIVGQCRICLVEIENMPKLQVACYTRVSDGMVVHLNSKRAQRARQQVLEFLLINHPIDCPVCDQSGECWLQEYYMKFGLYDSRMLEDKVKKDKAVVIGEHVVLDSERCILCTRCVRFCNEISKTHELGVFHRGDHSELRPYPGTTLDNPYSVNTVDICPVGALTERDFRFRVRVWYLEETESICPGCSTGCNITVHASNKLRSYKNDGRRIARLKPRYNGEVNEFWICDYGRYGFLYVDDHSRITAPQIRRDGEMASATWDEAVDATANVLQSAISHESKVGILASAQMTNEDLFALKKFAENVLNVSEIPVTVTPLTKPYSDDFLIREDKNPNTRGAELIGYQTRHEDTQKLLQACADGEISVLLIFQHDLIQGFEKDFMEKALSQVESLIFIGSNENSTSHHAHIVLPAATYVEKDGTFTNFAGRVQKINQAVEPLADSLAEWKIIRRVARKMEFSQPYLETEDVFKELARTVAVFSDMTYSAIGSTGMIVQENGHARKKEVVHEETVSK